MASSDKKKIIWGVGLAIFVILFFRYAPLPLYQFLLVFVNALCLREFMDIALPKESSSSSIFGVLLGTLLLAVFLWSPDLHLWLAAFAGVIILTFTFYLFRDQPVEISFKQITLTLFGCFYVSTLFSYTGFIRTLDHGYFWFFLLAGSTFANDTTAYFVGNLLGKHKLAPRISPGKTWEGFFGGMLGSILASLICRFAFWPEIPLHHCFILGILIGIVGPMGDLSESLIKRSVGVKDSGELIPGHGGLLDRVDALLFTGPVVYMYAKILV